MSDTQSKNEILEEMSLASAIALKALMEELFAIHPDLGGRVVARIARARGATESPELAKLYSVALSMTRSALDTKD